MSQLIPSIVIAAMIFAILLIETSRHFFPIARLRMFARSIKRRFRGGTVIMLAQEQSTPRLSPPNDIETWCKENLSGSYHEFSKLKYAYYHDQAFRVWDHFVWFERDEDAVVYALRWCVPK